MENKVWLITGISSGLGQALAQIVMENGDFVIGTFRSHEQAIIFNEQYSGKGLALKLDVTNPADIDAVFRTVTEQFGKIDVLVNNAGFGFGGAIEETSLSETRSVFETNFFGVLQLTQTFLPMFRKQRSGHIIQISSHGGVKAFPGFGIYNASKFALEGFSEALAQEVSSLGLNVTIVEPGPFRTNFAGSAFKTAEKIIEDYNPTAGAFRERMKQVNGNQEGDPQKAARAIFSISKSDTPPLRLPLGKIAIATLTAKLESVQKDLDEYREVAENSVF